MKNIKVVAASSLLYALPLFAFAQPSGLPSKTVGGVFAYILQLIDVLIPLLIALALLAFFWGLVRYIWSSGSGEGQKEGKSVMIAGIIGLFLMVGIWGIIGILENTFGTGSSKSIKAPRAPTF
jgi:hypothetical protein